MPEIRPPYVTAPSPLEQAVGEMQAQLHWAAMLIVALLELQDMRTCPHCGKLLKHYQMKGEDNGEVSSQVDIH